MSPAAVAVLTGRPDQRYHALAEVRARTSPRSFLSRPPSREDVDPELRRLAMDAGGNAVVDVHYRRGWSATSTRTLTAIGTAVIVDRHAPHGLQN